MKLVDESKMKLVVELNDFHELDGLVDLVRNQVRHLWAKWDNNSTEDQKIFMEMWIKNGRKGLPDDVDTYFKTQNEKVMFVLRTKQMYWDYKNGLERLKDLQKAYDRFNYNEEEPFEETHYGLSWHS